MSEQKDNMVPEIRFKGFDEEWKKEPFLSRIDKIVDFRGRTPKKLGLDWSESGYLALSALNVKDGYIDHAIDAHFGGQLLYETWMQGNELHQNQVLFTTEAPMGNVAQVPDNQKYILSQRTIAFVTNTSRLSENYLAIILKSPTVFGQLLAHSSGGTAKGVSQRSLASLSVVLSDDLSEQIQIGAYFKELDSLIGLHQRKHDKLVTLKQAMLQKMFLQNGATIPEIRFKGFEGDWEEKALEKLASFSKGQGYSKSDLAKTGIPILLYGSLYTNYQTEISEVNTFTNEKAGSIKSKGKEVVVPSSGETSEDIARASAIVKNGVIIGGDLNIIVPSEELDQCFLALTLSNGTLQKKLSQKAQGKSVVHVRNSDLAPLEIPFPSIDEQQKIGAYFRQLDTLISQHATQLKKLKQIKSACLEKMFV